MSAATPAPTRPWATSSPPATIAATCCRNSLAVAAITATVSPLALAAGRSAEAARTEASFGFTEVEAGVDETHHVAPGYRADILIRWGDPVLPGAPAFDPNAQTAAAQKQQFGYNNDFVGYFPIEGSSEHGLLVVNHEYTNEELMFPGLSRSAGHQGGRLRPDDPGAGRHRDGGAWRLGARDPQGRRPLAGGAGQQVQPPHHHRRHRDGARPARPPGMRCCRPRPIRPARRWSAWSTTAPAASRPGAPGSAPRRTSTAISGARSPRTRRWPPASSATACPATGTTGAPTTTASTSPRSRTSRNRFGWMVEIDPIDPTSTPKKRTALGRFKHEGAGVTVNKDGKVVAYMGDDERFDYLYRFVSAGTFDPNNRAANMDLLDEGTLSVAKFNDDGSLDWLPLVHGQGPLTGRERLQGPGRGADLGAARRRQAGCDQDGPPGGRRGQSEDRQGLPDADQQQQAQARAGRRRQPARRQPVRPHRRADAARRRSHGAAKFDLGHPGQVRRSRRSPRSAPRSARAPRPTAGSACPTTAPSTRQGRLWVATDGNKPRATGRADGVWAMETEGELRGTSRLFFRVPVGAEMCGPYFTPDDKTFFVAVQHPGEEDREGNPAHLRARPRPAGRTSRPACRRARRSSSSPRRTAA